MCELARAIVSLDTSSHMSFPYYYNVDIVLPSELFIVSEPVSNSFFVIDYQSAVILCYLQYWAA